MKRKLLATLFAFIAAVFYALNIPVSKRLLTETGASMMAAFLYLGAGVGIYLLSKFIGDKSNRITKEDMKYVIAMVVLDIIAPILLMLGLRMTSSSNASLLNNFEIVATSIIAFFIFKELISWRLWLAILLVTASCVILLFENIEGFTLNWGSLLILLAALAWGFENNCTRNLSHKSTYQIVAIKGIFSGFGSLIVALISGESIPSASNLGIILLLGFVAYGLSIFFYIKAQEVLGAAKTSAYYAITPFVAVGISVVFLQEPITRQFLIALAIMILGTVIIVFDTIGQDHCHEHEHILLHSQNGFTHIHKIKHSHRHHHLLNGNKHTHVHKHLKLAYHEDN